MPWFDYSVLCHIVAEYLRQQFPTNSAAFAYYMECNVVDCICSHKLRLRFVV